MEFKLYVGHLAAATTEQDLQQLFAQAGAVSSVSLVKDRHSGQSKGFAFVTMTTADGAQKAIAKFHNYELAGRRLAVNMAEPSKAARGPKAGQPAKAAPAAGYQSKLGAFSVTDRSPKVNAPPTRKTGGYQSKLGAFGTDSAPTPPRRRGGSQRH
jgi:RNA recognition motif-containing protein